MTSTPSDEPLVPGEGTTPPPPPPSGYETPAPPAAGPVPPPAYGATPPGGYTAPPAYGAQTAYGAPTGVPLSDADQRMWATLAHAGGILFAFVAPLIVWLVFRERGRFVDEQSKEALNFQITAAIAYAVCSVLTVIVIGAFLLPIVWLLVLVFGIMAAMAANKGEAYRYPMTLRLIK